MDTGQITKNSRALDHAEDYRLHDQTFQSSRNQLQKAEAKVIKNNQAPQIFPKILLKKLSEETN